LNPGGVTKASKAIAVRGFGRNIKPYFFALFWVRALECALGCALLSEPVCGALCVIPL